MSLVNAARREGTYDNGQGTLKSEQPAGAFGEGIKTTAGIFRRSATIEAHKKSLSNTIMSNCLRC